MPLRHGFPLISDFHDQFSNCFARAHLGDRVAALFERKHLGDLRRNFAVGPPVKQLGDIGTIMLRVARGKSAPENTAHIAALQQREIERQFGNASREPNNQIPAFPSNRTQRRLAIIAAYSISAFIMSIVILVSNWITFASVKERYSDEERGEEPGFIEGFRIAFSNRPFIMVTGIYLLSWLAIQFVQANSLLYVRYWMREDEKFAYLAMALQLAIFVFLIVWAKCFGFFLFTRNSYDSIICKR